MQFRFGRRVFGELSQYKQIRAAFDFCIAGLDGTVEIKLGRFFSVVEQVNRVVDLGRGKQKQHHASRGNASESNDGSEGRRKQLPAGNDGGPFLVEGVIDRFLNHVVLKKAQPFGFVGLLLDRGQQHGVEFWKFFFDAMSHRFSARRQG